MEYKWMGQKFKQEGIGQLPDEAMANRGVGSFPPFLALVRISGRTMTADGAFSGMFGNSTVRAPNATAERQGSGAGFGISQAALGTPSPTSVARLHCVSITLSSFRRFMILLAWYGVA
ncbi:hypothetical protein CPB84DRAFT_1747851 [Gymnopilus junonius]|uniref:Uncharacterized protein n=1 Tax=Gymnopilus junonius TaxID=109634 RepID=A0A9P5TLJ6_GYMJU|nr:hypothetical protein CPB84DRAFT_1747851 [Gymnopilus junonius]